MIKDLLDRRLNRLLLAWFRTGNEAFLREASPLETKYRQLTGGDWKPNKETSMLLGSLEEGTADMRRPLPVGP